MDPPTLTSARECAGEIRSLVRNVQSNRGLGEGSLAVSLALEEPAIETSGELSEPFARSTIKVVILAALLTERGGPKGLDPAEQDLARRMITDSDNDAAAELYSLLTSGSGSSAGAAQAMTDLLRQSGDSETTVPVSIPSGLPASFISNYGATDWLPENQVKFIQALSAGDLIDADSRAYVLELMEQVSSLGGDTWGLGTLSAPSRSRFKPGWGDTPSGQYLARQFGIIGGTEDRPQGSVALAALAFSQEDAYGAVTELAQGTARILQSPCSRAG